MSLQEKLDRDLQEAMKRRDGVRRSVLRLFKTAIHNKEIESRGPLDEAVIIDIIFKEAERRRESIEVFRQGQRQDLVAAEEAELAVILEYLPRMMSREEITEAVQEVIGQVGAQGPRDMGRVMGPLMARLKGKAQGKAISEIVSQLLAQKSSS